MASTYTYFSETLDDVTQEEADWIDKVLNLEFEEDSEVIKEFCSLLDCQRSDLGDDIDWWPSFSWMLEKEGDAPWSLWLYCDEGYREENLVLFMRTFIRRFRPNYVFTLTAAHTCSRMKIKEFGGSWMVITKDGVEGGNTWDAADDCLKKLREAE